MLAARPKTLPAALSPVIVGTVTSIGHKTDADGENLASRLARPAGTAPAVAMVHTQVDDAQGSVDLHLVFAPDENRLEAKLEAVEPSGRLADRSERGEGDQVAGQFGPGSGADRQWGKALRRIQKRMCL